MEGAQAQERAGRPESLKNVPDPGKQAAPRLGAWCSLAQNARCVLLLLKAGNANAAC